MFRIGLLYTEEVRQSPITLGNLIYLPFLQFVSSIVKERDSKSRLELSDFAVLGVECATARN